MSQEHLESGYKNIFQRALTAHLPEDQFLKLKKTKVLVAGLGGGSNIAELLVRKGFGHLIIADPDVYECHNVRQRGSLMSTLGSNKAVTMSHRVVDINPYVTIEVIDEGITQNNVEKLVQSADIVVDMLDLHALDEKIHLHRSSRKSGKYVLTAPSVINGAVLWVFAPDGVGFEEFSGYSKDINLSDYAWNLLKNAIADFPSEELRQMYFDAAYGKRSIPLDAIGVDQAAVLAACAIENIVFERWDRVVIAPQGLKVDASDPNNISKICHSASTSQKVATC